MYLADTLHQGSDGQTMYQMHAKHLATDFRQEADIRCKVPMAKILPKYTQTACNRFSHASEYPLQRSDGQNSHTKYMQSSLQKIFACKRISVAKLGWPKYAPTTCKAACNRLLLASEHPLQGSDRQHVVQTHAKQVATDFRLQANFR